MELKFNTGAEVPSIVYTNYVNINPYLFVWDAYKGSGGFVDGSYLVPFDRELFYNKRKILSSYRNYLQPIMNAIIDPVFSAPIQRKCDNDIFNTFVLDCDNKKTNLTTHTRDAVLLARLHGVVFAVVDNFPESPTTVSDAINTRTFPYVYLQPAYTVKSYETDKFNKLLTITFNGKEEIVDNVTYKTTMTWTTTKSIKIWYKDDKVLKTEISEHNLGVLPVIALYSDTCDSVMPNPPFYSIARLSCSLFNKDSELRDQERSQAFSVFYVQMDTQGQPVAIGPHSAITLPMDSNLNITPGYASPDSSILTGLRESINEFITSIFQVANQNGVTGLKTASSGIAEAYKFQAQASHLRKTAAIAVEYENALTDIVSKYIKAPITCTISYTTKYDTFYDQLSVEDISKLIQLDVPDNVKNEIKKCIIDKFLDHLNIEKRNELKETIDIKPRD